MIGQLTERHGQGGSCEAPGLPFRTYHNSYIVADPRRAWIVETAGRRWHAEPVADRGSISNLYTLDRDAGLAGPGGRPDQPGLPAGALAGRAGRLPRADHGRRHARAAARPRRGRAAVRAAGAAVALHARPARPLGRDRGRDGRAPAAGPPARADRDGLDRLRIALPERLPAGLPLRGRPAGGARPRLGAATTARSGWWAFERLQRLVAQAPALAGEARARLGELEARLRAEADATEAEAERLLRAGDRAAALGALRGLVDASTEQAIEPGAAADRRAGRPGRAPGRAGDRRGLAGGQRRGRPAAARRAAVAAAGATV